MLLWENCLKALWTNFNLNLFEALSYLDLMIALCVTGSSAFTNASLRPQGMVESGKFIGIRVWQSWARISSICVFSFSVNFKLFFWPIRGQLYFTEDWGLSKIIYLILYKIQCLIQSSCLVRISFLLTFYCRGCFRYYIKKSRWLLPHLQCSLCNILFYRASET